MELFTWYNIMCSLALRSWSPCHCFSLCSCFRRSCCSVKYSASAASVQAIGAAVSFAYSAGPYAPSLGRVHCAPPPPPWLRIDMSSRTLRHCSDSWLPSTMDAPCAHLSSSNHLPTAWMPDARWSGTHEALNVHHCVVSTVFAQRR